MAANPDHVRRDAEHAARVEIGLVLDRFKRRMYEQAKADIAREITDAGQGSFLDGTEIGRAAAARAALAYISDPGSEPVAGELGAGKTD